MARIEITPKGEITNIFLSNDDTVYYNGQVVKGSQLSKNKAIISITKTSVTIIKGE